jgi:protease II
VGGAYRAGSGDAGRFTLFTDWLVVEERQRGLTSIRQINRKTREVVGIAFDDPAYVTWIGFNPCPNRRGCAMAIRP